MAWRDRLSVYARCPKHPRFNPANGVGAVKVGCRYCTELTVLYRFVEQLRRRIGEFNDATARRKP